MAASHEQMKSVSSSLQREGPETAAGEAESLDLDEEIRDEGGRGWIGGIASQAVHVGGGREQLADGEVRLRHEQPEIAPVEGCVMLEDKAGLTRKNAFRAGQCVVMRRRRHVVCGKGASGEERGRRHPGGTIR